jgi:uncharacterized coiled-coil protein SlyX
MNKMIVIMAMAVIFAAGGCNESQTVKQLKLEKAQIVKEFNETKAQMQSQIDANMAKIASLEAEVDKQKKTVEGYNKILFDLVNKNKNFEKQVDELTKENQLLKGSAGDAKLDPAAVQEKLDKLKSLQQKAIEQQKQ